MTEGWGHTIQDIQIYYPINYGYIAGLCVPDGEEQDAYIIGVDEPVKTFTGIVVAIVRRFDDVEEKWVVVPQGASFLKEEIGNLCSFKSSISGGKFI